MHKGWMGLGLLLLTGCMSVPVATMVKMAGFDREDFLALEPEALRLKLTLDQNVPVQLAATRLELGAELDNGQQQLFAGSVRQEEYRQFEVDGGWFSREPEPRYQYLLALDEAGEAAIRDFQRVLTEDEVASASLNVRLDLDDEFDQPVQVTVEVKLSEQEGFFTLLDEATFEPERYRD
ncbi:hypothetical protein [Ferrimonas balearica]|uniref:hypothetical protein n=1 Tax=Ferrimonas balearica TaxID=44012 RepID=UPI001F2874E4|nr:hypothetical protein [Ferrimonas balearica]MBY6018605.1 hypothetical protein [Halomonas denitrificans]MBY6096444.1 hypothetical protein [Ferrimonas balearica]